MPTPQRLFEFFSNHPGLILAFVLVLGALIWTFIQGRSRGVKKVNPSDATRLINSEDAIIIDVRNEGEFKKGHILNAMHIPLSYLKDHLSKLEKHREQPVIMACRTGSESARGGAMLVGRGFQKVYTLNGGMLAWEAANLPVVKD
ncbi:MAG: rhodanese-like domain-containing protein [Gammaproteobacteria bacterium]|nr:rhodanese-like domain-containing protein [Gammaproteobacteria bacterium]